VTQQYIVKKKESLHMNASLSSGANILNAILIHLPKHVVKHSYRVEQLSAVLAKYVPEDELPEGIYPVAYQAALAKAGRYYEIGIYLARNDIQQRPVAAEKLLRQYWTIDIMPGFSGVIFETVRSIRERHDGQGYPYALAGNDVPFHAQICAIADTVDMIIGDEFSIRKMQKAKDFIRENNGSIFHPEAVQCFEQAKDELFGLYKKL